MPQAKPVAKPAVKTEPEAPAPKVLKSGDTFKVRNTGKRLLCLSKGSIAVDKVGLSTVAEYSNLSDFMEKV